MTVLDGCAWKTFGGFDQDSPVLGWAVFSVLPSPPDDAVAISRETGEWSWFREWDGAWWWDEHGKADEYRRKRQRRALQEIAKLDPDYRDDATP